MRDMLEVFETFCSVDGEGPQAGRLATFVRLSGCNLRCGYCDTKYAQEEETGTLMPVEDIVDIVTGFPAGSVTITGGEPCEQLKSLLLLVTKLTDLGYEVNVETNGSHSIVPLVNSPFSESVVVTMDYKTWSSGMSSRMMLDNLMALRVQDVLKFVIGADEDLLDVKKMLEHFPVRAQVFLSPVFGLYDPEGLVEFLKTEKLLGARVQMQLHKLIWPSDQRGV